MLVKGVDSSEGNLSAEQKGIEEKRMGSLQGCPHLAAGRSLSVDE